MASVHSKKSAIFHEVSVAVSKSLLYVVLLFEQADDACLDAGLTSSNSVRRDLDLKKNSTSFNRL